MIPSSPREQQLGVNAFRNQGTVDVAFGRKEHYAIRSEVLEPSKEPPIGCDVGLYESILREGAKIFKRTEVPRIGQRIDIQNLVASAEQIPNQVRADKASSPSNK